MRRFAGKNDRPRLRRCVEMVRKCVEMVRKIVGVARVGVSLLVGFLELDLWFRGSRDLKMTTIVKITIHIKTNV